jgi:hypothetical protein
MGYAVQSLHTEPMPPIFISIGSPREKVYAWMSLMASVDPVNPVHPVPKSQPPLRELPRRIQQ